ncbi:MAG TPA: MqnA/MqnD/SBP family protein, partial [Longimicrobiales bacterium]|nr:MqnA/MqnD/SBP family protein [Longimicrobiales bacterium]
MPRVIRVAHSPDSDDAFMFYALSAGKLDTGDLEFVHELQDIETLNRRALNGELEVTAVSIHAYAYLADKYALLPHGASMGEGYGPRLVAREPFSLEEVRERTVAIPGTLTSAYLALRLLLPDVRTVVVPFDEILDQVADGRVDAGLLIHEGQLTYADAGLHLIVDLGEWWAKETGGLPLPLGGNVIRRDLGDELIQRVSALLHESIKYALEHRAPALAHAGAYGRGLDERQTDEFVGMYVNARTLDY